MDANIKFLNIKISKFTDFLAITNLFSTNYARFYFRGHGNASWKLESSLYRYVQKHNSEGEFKARDLFATLEYNAYDILQRKTHLFPPDFSIPDDNPELPDYAEWFSNLQHYGGNTRFIDFTLSWGVAVFFMLSADSYSEHSVWAIPTSRVGPDNGQLFNYQSSKAISELLEDSVLNDNNLEQLLNSEIIFSIEPKKSSNRMEFQQGVLLFSSDYYSTLNEIIENDYKMESNVVLTQDFKIDQNYFYKIDFSSDLDYQIRVWLNMQNVLSTVLFPDFRGLLMDIYPPDVQEQIYIDKDFHFPWAAITYTISDHLSYIEKQELRKILNRNRENDKIKLWKLMQILAQTPVYNRDLVSRNKDFPCDFSMKTPPNYPIKKLKLCFIWGLTNIFPPDLPY